MTFFGRYTSWWLHLRWMARRFEWGALALSRPMGRTKLRQELPLKIGVHQAEGYVNSCTHQEQH